MEKEVNETKPLSKFQKMAIYFMIYAFIGWIGEEIFCVIYTLKLHICILM